MSVGFRASQAVRARARENGTSIERECELIGCSRPTERNWRYKGYYPGGYHLLQMHLKGYDIMKILLGDEHGK